MPSIQGEGCKSDPTPLCTPRTNTLVIKKNAKLITVDQNSGNKLIPSHVLLQMIMDNEIIKSKQKFKIKNIHKLIDLKLILCPI